MHFLLIIAIINYYKCVNNKTLESHWSITAHIYSSILLIELQNCDPSDYQ